MSLLIRERLTSVAKLFEKLEVALFTSFSFNGDFFEQNVLPALFGIDPDTPPATRNQQVHRRLLQTRVGVFYDPSQLKASRQSFRYTQYPVLVPGSLFHPKNIILIGIDGAGTRWMYVASMSANLSLSGWGRNCEGFGDTWVHASSEQPATAVKEFLAWLKEQVGNDTAGDPLREAIRLSGALQIRRSKSIPHGADRVDSVDRTGVNIYFSPLHQSMWSFVREKYGAITALRAASPYWGDAEASAKELAGIPVSLVASRMPRKFVQTNLGKDTVQAFIDDGSSPTLESWTDGANRFHHLKLYELKTGHGAVTGIGSCNFTRRGQFWLGDAGKPIGNVESMLFDTAKFKWPPTQPLAAESLAPTSTDEDAPMPWPFYVFVQYDWKSAQYSWKLQGEIGQDTVELRLASQIAPIIVSAGQPKGKLKADLDADVFHLIWRENRLEGSVTQINLDSSTREYGTPLGASDILDAWKTRTDPSGGEGEGDGDETKAPDDEAEDETGRTVESEQSIETFDSFHFFQAAKAFRIQLEEVENHKDRILDLLIGQPASLSAFANAVRSGGYPLAAKFVVIRECLDLIVPYREIPNVAAMERSLKSELALLRNGVAAELKEELRARKLARDGDAILNWYITKLKK
ncbi:hypothetical protein ACFWP0_17520 [Achromobacter sp. NPDC058515]|uniref:hypothetical protein n=1 Tax=Achromobacter sp. NPDC058515 TaxID=3346533 RepID=UPI00364C2B2E